MVILVCPQLRGHDLLHCIQQLKKNYYNFHFVKTTIFKLSIELK